METHANSYHVNGVNDYSAPGGGGGGGVVAPVVLTNGSFLTAVNASTTNTSAATAATDLEAFINNKTPSAEQNGDALAADGQKNTHVCIYCDKEFSALAKLQRHIRKHTGEKPFRCLYCEMRFSRSDNLHTHMVRRHTDEADRVCTECGDKYHNHSWSQWYQHLKYPGGAVPPQEGDALRDVKVTNRGRRAP